MLVVFDWELLIRDCLARNLCKLDVFHHLKIFEKLNLEVIVIASKLGQGWSYRLAKYTVRLPVRA
jgi:hypothetical protein